jgi:hypothetical protein
MRNAKAWENMDKAQNVEYQRRYAIPERERTLESELVHYIPSGEANQVLTTHLSREAVISRVGRVRS